MLRRAPFLLSPLAALLLVGCPKDGAGGDNFLIGKWTAPPPCVRPGVEFRAMSATYTDAATGPYPEKTWGLEASYVAEGAERMHVNGAVYRRVDADHVVNESIPECTYTRVP